MKVLFISQYFYPESFKGNDIVFDFVKRGYDVTVLTGKPNYPEGKFYEGYQKIGIQEEVIQGAKIIRTQIFPRMSGQSIPLALNYLSFVVSSYFTVMFKMKEKYDVIFVQQLSPVTMALPGLWIKKKQNIPLFLWVLDLWPESVTANSSIKKGRVIGWLNKMVKNIYEKSDVILISSKFFRKSILEKCDDKNKEIVYFPNWAEDLFVEPQPYDNDVPDLPEGFNIMFAGNIGESQGFESVLAAAELTKDKNINWILVGSGRKVQWIEEAIANKNLTNVILLGRYPLSSMPSFFKKADVMLVSLKDEPIFALTVPAKVQAYMASGKPILGILNGEGQALINESCAGFAVNASDSDTLAKKSIELSELSNVELDEMGKRAEEYYKNNFEKEYLFSKLNELFQSVNKG